MRPITRTRWHSFCLGEVSQGCRKCVKGQKLVLFVTGLCPKSCYYCPLSEQKMKKDVVFANERPVAADDDIIEEAELMDAKGAGITGGDPLMVLGRTLRHIALLRKRFGSHFHIHLYTPLDLVDQDKLSMLYSAGLDEIRFHPDLDDDKLWNRISLAGEFSWSAGVEIPVIPGKEKETLKLLGFLEGKVDFVNLNELELSDTNASRLSELGFCAKDDMSYAAAGSHEMAMSLLSHCRDRSYAVHYCTSRLKDKVQLRERIKRMAKNAKQDFDKLTGDSMLIRGAVYPEGAEPGYGKPSGDLLNGSGGDKGRSHKGLGRKKLEAIAKELSRHNIKKMLIDERGERVLLRASELRRIASKLSYRCAVVEEYPTWDHFPVEVEFLN